MYDIEPRQLIYNRTGNFSQTTTLDNELAEQFMRASDLRLDVLVTDSDKKPEQSSVAVGSDVLAWRTVVPLSELTKIVLRPKRYRQNEIVDGKYRIQIHDQIIDDDIRRGGYQDREDYDRKYLARLNTEVKGGLVDALWWEKLGLRTQFTSWQPYISVGVNLPSMLYDGNLDGIVTLAGVSVFVIHPFYAFVSNMFAKRYHKINEFLGQQGIDARLSLPPGINPRDWKHAFMPTVPVDKWYKGRRFLAQHGTDLIIARS